MNLRDEIGNFKENLENDKRNLEKEMRFEEHACSTCAKGKQTKE